MTKRVYRADATNTATGMAVIDVADDYVLQENETFTAPSGNLKTPLTLVDGKWVGASDEVVAANEAAYLAANPDAVAKPSTLEQAVASLSYQVMQGQQTITHNQDTITALQQSNAQLAYQVMTLTATDNGGTK